jgi:rhodanese-related sulfurtransferase
MYDQSMIRRFIFFALVVAFASIILFAETDPWQASDLIQPADLAARLKGAGPKPVMLYVGYPALYHGAHLPDAIFAGPAGKADGLALLKTEAAKAGKQAEIVIYCGCCPLPVCPNLRPAFRTLRESGYKNVKVVLMPTNLSTDWISKGYPIVKPAGAEKM